MLFIVLLLAALGILLIYSGFQGSTPQAVIKSWTGAA